MIAPLLCVPHAVNCVCNSENQTLLNINLSKSECVKSSALHKYFMMFFFLSDFVNVFISGFDGIYNKQT